ncbi:hypothetical protein TrVGV298_009732 [Trichoderma virens]|nr:hypothetical protein TrVGV298_009732 [Trichoderma virens]UKZ81657.1 hypothetical protein TrVFT333_009429 [Trichoderma virens FT-333]
MQTDQTEESSRVRACARRACQECSRKKSKCDRALPSCSSCQKYRRVCNYERPDKTPLTRKYNTAPQVFTWDRDIMNSLESPPISGSFEWDERNGQPGGQKFVDGMGSLTSDVDGSGYLGVASGAALLRMTAGHKEHRSGTASPRASIIPFAITSLSALDGYIDDYFSLYHRSYPIIHEATFRAQFMEVIPRPSGNAWQVLLYVVAALGAWSTATQQADAHTGLFEAAKARFSIDLLETGNLVLVQALTLMSNYAQMGNKPNSSYNYYGLARRIAMGIGLHKEFSAWQLNPLVVEMRRRVWWCLYAFDVGSIITFSRPFDFPQTGVDVELPTNIHDIVSTAGIFRNDAQLTDHLGSYNVYNPKTTTSR